ncbi:hypothetical protein DFJ74DRAFT_607608 [Hyaloraphidium curvatum]|nr:hypothetical protein DFJ74DRAFT_607608 [Hyaloraphidium curvatum]
MGFGSPGHTELSRPSPPDLGSFPLDRQGEFTSAGPASSCGVLKATPGTCRDLMAQYLKCLKSHKAESQACRELSKQYLICRMDKWEHLAAGDVATLTRFAP